MSSRHRHARRIDGVLLLDKPPGIGSNAVLQHARRLFAAERAGHTGTLDPMASGLLALCFGEATKFSGELLEAGKSYVATLRLGERTATGDAEGEVLERRPVSVTREQLSAVLERFRGEIRQVPPMYSALKRAGRPLYEYARQGIEVERDARTVAVTALVLDRFEGAEATLSVECSKGTYIRTLAEDIGEALGCGAHLCKLVRTGIGRFRLEQAHRFEAIEALPEGERPGLLLPVDALVRDLPELALPEPVAAAFRQGQAVSAPCAAQGRVRVYAADGRFLGVGLVEPPGSLRPKRLVSGA